MDGLIHYSMKKIINYTITILILVPWPLVYAELCERKYLKFMLEYFTVGMQVQGLIYLFAFIALITHLFTGKKNNVL
jgi:hypothetical protein